MELAFRISFQPIGGEGVVKLEKYRTFALGFAEGV